MYGQLYRQGVNSLSIVGRLSTLSIHVSSFPFFPLSMGKSLRKSMDHSIPDV